MSATTARKTPAPPLRLRAFVAVITIAAQAALVAAILRDPRLPLGSLPAAIILTVMVAAAHRYPVYLSPRLKISADSAPAFAAVLLLPAPLAIAVSLLGGIGGEAARRTALIQIAFNVSAAALRAALGAGVYHALSGADGFALFESARDGTALVLTALVMYAVNTGLVDGVIAVQRKSNPFAGWWTRHQPQLLHEGSMYLLGLLVAATAERSWIALLLLTAPSVVMYRSLRDGVAARSESRKALENLADEVDQRDPHFARHSLQTADLARLVAQRLHMTPAAIESVFLAARVHDIGMIGVRAAVLGKATRLTDAEWAELQGHAETSARLLGLFPDQAEARAAVLAHHERWDGRGYPAGLRGEQIPLTARVVAAADAFIAMTSPRPYRPALSADIVRAELLGGRGTQFDPRVVDALLDVVGSHPRYALGGRIVAEGGASAP